MRKITLESVELAGFRAYLSPQTIELHSKNLAIFAPNGRGKSSLADAIEFYLSEGTTLLKFGEKATGNQAGYIALTHNAAEKAGVKPYVTLRFKAPGETFGTARYPDGKMPRTEAGDRVANHHRVDAVIRGHSLRGFVESTSPDQRYTQVADWLSLSALTEAQKAMKALRDQVSSDVKDTSHKTGIERRISRLSGDAVKSWDEAMLSSWLRATYLIKQSLGDVVFKFESNDSLKLALRTLVREAEAKVGLIALKTRLAAIQKIIALPEAGNQGPVGSVVAFQNAVDAVELAAKAERDERSAASESAFHDVWTAVEPLLGSEGLTHDACPVCTSEWPTTPLGTRSAVHAYVVANLAALKSYDAARRSHAEADRKLSTCREDLARSLAECSEAFRDFEQVLSEACDEILCLIAARKTETADSDLGRLVSILSSASAALSIEVQAAQHEQNDGDASKALTAFDSLVTIFSELEIDRLQREQLSKIATELDKQAAFVSSQIRSHITELLDELRRGTNDIYRAIQGDGAATVRLELPKETDKLQNRLGILIDFAENRRGVAPSGYLSDSQLHSVALALRLAAIRRFNPGMPLIVLDDISTSYDADYRRHLVTALKTWMGDCQLIVLTHDQRFFTYLREMLPSAEWTFKQINALEPGYGPKMAAHLIKDEEVEQAWAENKLAANIMRQIEDETLLRWAQDFEVDIRIRKTNKPFDYGRAELADAIARFFRETGLKPPKVAGVFNPFLDSLRDGNVENFGSHFQDGPWGDGSEGDERARWAEFKAFRSALKCPKCNGTRFRRPFPQRYAVCAKPKCETQLRFDGA